MAATLHLAEGQGHKTLSLQNTVTFLIWSFPQVMQEAPNTLTKLTSFFSGNRDFSELQSLHTKR